MRAARVGAAARQRYVATTPEPVRHLVEGSRGDPEFYADQVES